MPQYSYECPVCGREVVKIKKVDDRDDVPECKHCPQGTLTKRMMSLSEFRVNGYSEANGYSSSK